MKSALTALILVAACRGEGDLPTASLTVGGATIRAELATNTGQRAKGLMMRDSLPADDGMLFAYPNDAIREFWMKDTRIPLSIAFLDKNGKILRIADMRPFDEGRTSSVWPARYALETNVGWFAAHHVEPGAVIEGIPPDLKAE